MQGPNQNSITGPNPANAAGAGLQAALIERAQAGEAEALEELLVSVQPQLYRFSMKMCGHEQDAQDCLQDTMLALASSFNDFRGASSLSTWLYAITPSICIKQRRRSKFAPKVEESWEGLDAHERNSLASPDPGPEAQAQAGELRERVQLAIGRPRRTLATRREHAKRLSLASRSRCT